MRFLVLGSLVDRLVEELWGDDPPASAAKVVQKYVSQLRRVLGAEVIVRRGSAYLLAAADTDAAEFERLLALSKTQEPAAASQTLRSALALWRGRPYADVEYERWTQAEIARLEELRQGALEERIEAELQLGEAARIVPELEALVAEHPLRERLVALLMLALYRSGRQAEALEAFTAARSRLVEELAIEPGPELKDMQRRILVQDPELGPAPRPLRLLRRKVPAALVLLGAALIVGGLAAAVVEFTGRSNGTVVLAPNTVGEIDATNGRVLAQIPLPGRPAAWQQMVALSGSAVMPPARSRTWTRERMPGRSSWRSTDSPATSPSDSDRPGSRMADAERSPRSTPPTVRWSNGSR